MKEKPITSIRSFFAPLRTSRVVGPPLLVNTPVESKQDLVVPQSVDSADQKLNAVMETTCAVDEAACAPLENVNTQLTFHDEHVAHPLPQPLQDSNQVQLISQVIEIDGDAIVPSHTDSDDGIEIVTKKPQDQDECVEVLPSFPSEPCTSTPQKNQDSDCSIMDSCSTAEAIETPGSEVRRSSRIASKVKELPRIDNSISTKQPTNPRKNAATSARTPDMFLPPAERREKRRLAEEERKLRLQLEQEEMEQMQKIQEEAAAREQFRQERTESNRWHMEKNKDHEAKLTLQPSLNKILSDNSRTTFVTITLNEAPAPTQENSHVAQYEDDDLEFLMALPVMDLPETSSLSSCLQELVHPLPEKLSETVSATLHRPCKLPPVICTIAAPAILDESRIPSQILSLAEHRYFKLQRNMDMHGLLWPDKYAPQSIKEIVENQMQAQQLLQWLSRWSSVEEQSFEKDSEHDDGDKFDLSGYESESNSSDYSDEGRKRKSQPISSDNVSLIVGPSGCGKSSVIRICAEALGLRVIEINTSAVRSGKAIMDLVQEATQSHRVSVQKSASNISQLDCSGAKPCFVKDENVVPAKSRKPEKRSTDPSAVLKKRKSARIDSDSSSEESDDFIPALKKRSAKLAKPEPPAPLQEPATKAKTMMDFFHTKTAKKSPTTIVQEVVEVPDDSQAIAQVSSTIILFEDVDVVFDDDKGFWPAVENLCYQSKRPIIMTSTENSPNIGMRVSPATFHFNAIPDAQMADHLSAIAYAEKVIPDSINVPELVRKSKGNFRKGLLELQLEITAVRNLPTELLPAAGYDSLALSVYNDESHLFTDICTSMCQLRQRGVAFEVDDLTYALLISANDTLGKVALQSPMNPELPRFKPWKPPPPVIPRLSKRKQLLLADETKEDEARIVQSDANVAVSTSSNDGVAKVTNFKPPRPRGPPPARIASVDVELAKLFDNDDETTVDMSIKSTETPELITDDFTAAQNDSMKDKSAQQDLKCVKSFSGQFIQESVLQSPDVFSNGVSVVLDASIQDKERIIEVTAVAVGIAQDEDDLTDALQEAKLPENSSDIAPRSKLVISDADRAAHIEGLPGLVANVWMLDRMSAADFSSDWKKKDLDQTLQPEEYYYDAMQPALVAAYRQQFQKFQSELSSFATVQTPPKNTILPVPCSGIGNFDPTSYDSLRPVRTFTHQSIWLQDYVPFMKKINNASKLEAASNCFRRRSICRAAKNYFERAIGVDQSDIDAAFGQ